MILENKTNQKVKNKKEDIRRTAFLSKNILIKDELKMSLKRVQSA